MRLISLSAVMLLVSCASVPSGAAQDAHLARIRALCGQAFEGRVVSPQVEADASFAGKTLVMHVRDCSTGEVRIPFHVGGDRSRTWVIRRTANGIELKHDHRHEDGSEDPLTQYGGTTTRPGSALRQEYPADAFSKELFVREGIPVSSANIWATEVEPGRVFAYELHRPGRFFRVEFDLTRPVAPPPPPWGAKGET